jgi:hypothetical protein
MEALLAWIFLFVSICTVSPYWAMASGLFAIAANVNLIYHKED